MSHAENLSPILLNLNDPNRISAQQSIGLSRDFTGTRSPCTFSAEACSSLRKEVRDEDLARKAYAGVVRRSRCGNFVSPVRCIVTS
jgi:hypothetical protein